MVLGHQGYVSIAELVVYIPCLMLAGLICFRHGVHRASGWIYTLMLCLVRIIGAICQLLTYSNHSSGLFEATLILDSVGLSPLLLATLGMLSRFFDWINAKGTQVLSVKQFRLIQLLISVGMILSIVGGTSMSPSPDGTFKISSTTKAAIVLYIIAFAGLTYFLFLAFGYRAAAPTQEQRVPLAVAMAWPFILVRLLYSVVAIFVHNHSFSLIGGSIAVHVCMAVVEEFVVVVDYLVLGFSLQKLEPEEQGGCPTVNGSRNGVSGSADSNSLRGCRE
ncbi:hypothetical protein PT974_03070 [Cladobotryum mycophilum]|uniref:DUF7702 domain-containing protein n=1 Tax=Cladobotryum mycophilum TaxID=491253 RepID=A0ABR0SX06_9HYPO